MSLRRIITVLGPAAVIGALAVAIGGGCLSWSIDAPEAAAFVSRGLTRDYGVALAAEGPFKLSLLPLPSLGFRNARLTAGGPDGPVLAEGGTLSIQLNLSALLFGRTEIVALGLDGVSLALPDGDDTRWDEPVRRLVARLASENAAHPRRVTLKGVTLTGRGGGARTARDLDLTLSWPFWSDTLQLAGSLVWHGQTTRFALAELRPSDLASGGASPFTASVTWPAGSLGAEGSGKFGERWTIAGHGRFQTHALLDTLAWIGRDMALSPLIEALALDGTFEADRRSLRLPKLHVSAGGTVLDGAASLELSGDRPSIRATLATEALNLGPVLAGALRVAGLDGTQDGWGHHSLALGPLTGGDLDLRLSGNAARLGPLLLEDVAASVIVRDDSIDATLARAGVQGGTLKGHVVLSAPRGTNADETEVKAQGAFAGFDLGALLVEAGQVGWAIGQTQGSFALEGKGRDAESLVARVGGRANLAMDSGAIAGLDLADVIHRGGVVAPGALARRNGRTSFDRAGVSLTFSDGLGTITEGDLTARALIAKLRGHLSLPDKHLTARVELLPRNAATVGDVPNGRFALFEIAGPWDAVSVKAASRKDVSEPFGFLDASQMPAALPMPARAYAQ